jgi:WD40-like Beta Propeller Repeat
MRTWIVGAVVAAALVGVSSASSNGGSFTPWSVASNLESVPGTSPDLNTPFLDGCPFASADGRSLYIASNRPNGLGGIDIWVSRRERRGDPWGAPENLGAPINSASDDFCPSPTRGQPFFFVSTRPGGCGDSDIYVVLRMRHGWTGPRNLGCDVNSAASEAGPVLLEKGHSRVLYFSSTRPGGFAPDSGSPADADIYVSAEGKRGGFAPPVLADGVNSAANDARPHLDENGTEIVFDSDRAGTLGGPDIWSSTRPSLLARWSEPVNLGPGINSPAAETRASFADRGRTLHFGSTRAGSEPAPTGGPSQDLYVASREPLGRRAANCASPRYDNHISGTLAGDLEISLYGTVCVVTGTVQGDVVVRNADPRCRTRPPFVALDLQGGTIKGDVSARGGACVMVWLGDRGVVKGDIAYKADGNLGFLGNVAGAVVRGSVFLGSGLLWATGTSTTNRIDGTLACRGGRPVGSADLAIATNWDGAGLEPADRTVDIDGTIGGRYRC